MKFIKLFPAALIFLSLTHALPAERRENDKVQNQTQAVENRPPVISSFTSSRSLVVAPCPFIKNLPTGCDADDTCTVALSAAASDPDGDPLLYTYSVTGGTLTGEAGKTNWNLSGVDEKTYTATVEVRDQRGGVASQSVSVTVVPHGRCHAPCIVVSVACPKDVSEGQSVVFTALISGAEPDVRPNFNWTISNGKIVKGLGTNSIKVDTTGLGGRELEATVVVGGYPPECQNQASCKRKVKKKSAK